MGNVVEKRLAFAGFVHAGMDHWEAARKAGYGGKVENKDALGVTAARLLKTPDVIGALSRLRLEKAEQAQLMRVEVLAKLCQIVDKGENCDVIQAARQLSKMHGWDAPKKIEVNAVQSMSDAELRDKTAELLK